MKLNFFVCLVLVPLTLSSIRRQKWKKKCLCSPAKIEWLTNDSYNILLAWRNHSSNIKFKKKLNFIRVIHNLVIFELTQTNKRNTFMFIHLNCVLKTSHENVFFYNSNKDISSLVYIILVTLIITSIKS